MSDSEKTLNTFTTRVRQLILLFNQTKKENEELYAMVDERDQKIKTLEEQLEQARKEYATLKLARMLRVTSGDVENAKQRVAKLIRDLDKCITLLSK